jgi:hypothetical protein
MALKMVWGLTEFLVIQDPFGGDVPAQSLIYAFDTNADTSQSDVGLDGLFAQFEEGAVYTNYASDQTQQRMIT